MCKSYTRDHHVALIYAKSGPPSDTRGSDRFACGSLIQISDAVLKHLKHLFECVLVFGSFLPNRQYLQPDEDFENSNRGYP